MIDWLKKNVLGSLVVTILLAILGVLFTLLVRVWDFPSVQKNNEEVQNNLRDYSLELKKFTNEELYKAEQRDQKMNDRIDKLYEKK